ncbi:NAD(P)-dependent oxidoreductase [Candidatus Protochlamydia phocaeensis]|uniref:NAD(P)-dependent oxidoreductase n=1 Tax=Candidatus Protochlamydia phocaeensis TaxID=1414722 RepID=UPI000837EC67|nr:NAD(P)-dependent oxidoreductase [Candidatus Protochlamydia phocaeensis]
MKESVSFIGLGKMGFPMAHNLLKAGFPLKVYNRSIHKADPLLKEGAQLLNSPKEAFETSSLLMTMLANDDAVEEIVYGPQGIGERLKEGCIHLSMSTISPETSRKLQEFHQKKGAIYLAAPVLGRPEAAEAKKLWIIVAGEEQAKTRVRPLLDCLGQGVLDFGEDPSQANIVKLLCNFLIFSTIEALAEISALAKKNQISQEPLWDLISNKLFACPVYQTYGKIIASQNFATGDFKMKLGLKDMRLVQDLAKASQAPMPLASLLCDRLLVGLAKGRESLDSSGLALVAWEEAGLLQEKETI